MRQQFCPRCGKRDVIPIEYGKPEDELVAAAERGDAVVGGCVVSADPPDVHCRFCQHDWQRRTVPEWAPPRAATEMDELSYALAAGELDERLQRTDAVVRAFRERGITAAAHELALLRDWLGDDDVRCGLSGLVVPTDRVLLAELLDAALGICGLIDRLAAPALFESAKDRAELRRVDQRYDEAEAELRRLGLCDFAEPEEDDEDDWLSDEERWAALLGSGEGSELPEAGEAWDDWLDETAKVVFCDGSALGWARYVWSRLGPEALTLKTDLDRARAQVRLVALEVLRQICLELLDGGTAEGWRATVEDPGINPYYLGYLAAAEGADPGQSIGAADYEQSAEGQALEELVRVESSFLRSRMMRGLGVSDIFATMWASRYDGVRFPLSAEAMDEAVNENLTVEKHIAFACISEGMSL
jgi:hypothetical protein